MDVLRATKAAIKKVGVKLHMGGGSDSGCGVVWDTSIDSAFPC